MIEYLTNSLMTKITLLLVVALIVDLTLHRRHVLKLATCWNAVLLSILVMPLATVLMPKVTLPVLPGDTFQRKPAPSVVSIVMDNNDPSPVAHGPQWSPPVSTSRSAKLSVLLIECGLPAIYLSGVVLFLIRLLASFRAINALILNATPVAHPAWRERLDYWCSRLQPLKNRSVIANDLSGRIQEQLSIKKKASVCLLTSDRIEVPMAMGVFQSTILIPHKLIPQMTREDIDAILTHELAHVVRCDFLWQLLQRVVEAALWFHPIFWIALRRMEFVRERACDEFAVHQLGDVQTYAKTLLDIAAGMQKGNSRNLGLAITRPTGLAKRLDAMTDDGDGQYIASARFRCLATAGIITAAMGMARIDIDRALGDDKLTPAPAKVTGETPLAGDPDAGSAHPTTLETRSPELIAITWQQIRENNPKHQMDQPVWRPDGTLLAEDESKALRQEANGFQAHWWNEKENLRPLVFLFRGNPKFGTGFMTRIVMPNDDRLVSGTWHPSTESGLCKSASSPSLQRLSEWPAKIDLEFKVPVEPLTVIKTLDTISDEPVDFGPGARWYLDHDRGQDRTDPQKPISGLTAAVLELRYDSIKNLTNHSVKVWLKGKKDPLRNDYVTIIEREPGVRSTIYVTVPIEDPQMIEKVEFFRQRFRFERINGIETHLDLIPEKQAKAGQRQNRE